MEVDVTGLFWKTYLTNKQTAYWQQQDEREDVCKYLEFSTSVLAPKAMKTKDLWEGQR